MNNYPQTHFHPLEKADALESPLRLLLQNPRRILKKYIHSGMTVLDLGCGTETKVLISEQKFQVSRYRFNTIIQKM